MGWERVAHASLFPSQARREHVSIAADSGGPACAFGHSQDVETAVAWANTRHADKNPKDGGTCKGIIGLHQGVTWQETDGDGNNTPNAFAFKAYQPNKGRTHVFDLQVRLAAPSAC